MLDDFKDNEFYKYATNLTNFYHAYIFEVLSITSSFPIILAFAKMLICKNHYTNNSKCRDCNICHLIDENYYADLKIIEPDGAFIKKEQVQMIEQELSLKSSNDTNQVYIIKYADKMNQSASNSLLKFIEEPEPGIYAILVTENKNNILPTILSRCNLITLNIEEDIEYNEEDIKNLIDFLAILAKEKENSLPYTKSKFLDIYKTRDDIIKAFNMLEVIISSEINRKYGINSVPNYPFCDIIKTTLGDISLNELIFYLEVIVRFKNDLVVTPNLNLNLLMDRFVIEMSRVEVI